MKKFFPLFVLVSLFIALPSSASAEASSSTKVQRATDRIEKMEARVASREAKIVNRIEAKEEKIASRAAMFTQKIATFRNKQKAQVAQRVNLSLGNINQNRTQSMSNRLDKITEILTKVEARVNTVSSNGTDVSSATQAISQAKSAIEAAEMGISAQANNDYTITVTTEAQVGQDAKAVRTDLLADLKATQSLVIAARQAVANAISVSASTLKGSNGGQ